MSADVPQGPFDDDTDPDASASPEPPTATAIAAWSQELEEKMVRFLDEQHTRQMSVMLSAIREGQTEALKHYQVEWSGHRAELAVAIKAFDSEFGRAIRELQETTHHTANVVQGLGERLSTHDDQFALYEKRLQSLERWRYDKTPGTQPPPPNIPDADLPRDR